MSFHILGTKVLEGSEETTYIKINTTAFSQGAKDHAIGMRFQVRKEKLNSRWTKQYSEQEPLIL